MFGGTCLSRELLTQLLSHQIPSLRGSSHLFQGAHWCQRLSLGVYVQSIVFSHDFFQTKTDSVGVGCVCMFCFFA